MKGDNKIIHMFCMGVCLAVAFVFALAGRWVMNPDGICYLDMSDGVTQGHWSWLFNTAWSSLYPFLLGLARLVAGDSPEREFPLAHMVNFGIYVFSLAMAGALIHEWTRAQGLGRKDSRAMAGWIFFFYAWWLWISLKLITLKLVAPDLLGAGFILGACACALRLLRRGPNVKVMGALGVLLAGAYGAKSFYLMWGLVLLGLLALMASRNDLKRQVMGAGIIFALLSGLYVVGLSWTQGRWTLGETGRFNWIYCTQGFSWRTVSPQILARMPSAPQQIFEAPRAFSYAFMDHGTHTEGYALGVFNRGLPSRWDSLSFFRNLKSNIRELGDILWGGPQAVMMVLTLVLFLGGAWHRVSGASVAAQADWVLRWAALVGMMAYALIHVEPRYVAGFMFLLVMGCLPHFLLARRWAWIMAVVVGLFLVWPWARDTLYLARGMWRGTPQVGSFNEDRLLYHEALALDMKPQDKAAFIGDGSRAFWLRLMRVRVIAEVLQQDKSGYFSATQAQQEALAQAFKNQGARWMIMTSSHTMEGWQRVGSSDYWLMKLDMEKNSLRMTNDKIQSTK